MKCTVYFLFVLSEKQLFAEGALFPNKGKNEPVYGTHIKLGLQFSQVNLESGPKYDYSKVWVH